MHSLYTSTESGTTVILHKLLLLQFLDRFNVICITLLPFEYNVYILVTWYADHLKYQLNLLVICYSFIS